MTAPPRRKQTGSTQRARSSARLAAVQALYQMDLSGGDVTDVVEEFRELRFRARTPGPEAETSEFHEEADATFFSELMHGVVRRQRDIDPLIDRQLATGWRLKRIDSTLRAVLRAAVLELLERSDVPARVVINEYVNVAHSFFDADEPKVVNGVLDAIARQARPAEFDGARDNAR